MGADQSDMKIVPRLRTLIALMLISGNACFAQTQTPSPQVLLPERHKCLDLLELERVKVNRDGTLTYPDHPQLGADFLAVDGWLRGFFSAVNLLNKDTDGNVTKGATGYPLMLWVFSYCRAHPSDRLAEAALELLKAFRGDTTTRK
jgi:hypothetical protein